MIFKLIRLFYAMYYDYSVCYVGVTFAVNAFLRSGFRKLLPLTAKDKFLYDCRFLFFFNVSSSDNFQDTA